MKHKANKNCSYTGQSRMIMEMINASLRAAEKLGLHPLTKGCNCICCIHKRKRILEPSKKNWKFKL